MWYMPAPVVVVIEVPQPVQQVYSFLDLMANHEAFNDHLMRDWSFSGPTSGVGARAQVRTRAMGVSDVVDIEVIAAEAPTSIVESNTAHKAGRVGQGTYTLSSISSGGTRITFEYRWMTAPLMDRAASPFVRAYIRRNNETAMRRLAAQLGGQPSDSIAES